MDDTAQHEDGTEQHRTTQESCQVRITIRWNNDKVDARGVARATASQYPQLTVDTNFNDALKNPSGLVYVTCNVS